MLLSTPTVRRANLGQSDTLHVAVSGSRVLPVPATPDAGRFVERLVVLAAMEFVFVGKALS